jgi:DNA-binding GntR family transcriptional regulator
MSGDLQVGDFVRVARTADELEISHTPVREALSALRAEGILELEPNRGFRVAHHQPAGDVEDMFLVQAFVGGELAARAAERLSDQELEQLRTICDEFDAAASGPPFELERLNRAFHDTINDGAGSPALARFYNSTVPISRRNGLVPGWTELSVHDHRAILTVLEMHDPEFARDRVTGHLKGISRLVVDALGDGPAVAERG